MSYLSEEELSGLSERERTVLSLIERLDVQRVQFVTAASDEERMVSFLSIRFLIVECMHLIGDFSGIGASPVSLITKEEDE
jgi:hypothetical protein